MIAPKTPLYIKPPEPDDLTVALRYVQLTLAAGALAALLAAVCK